MASKTSPPDEGKAISELGKILAPFEADAQGRILQWAISAFNVKTKEPAANGVTPKLSTDSTDQEFEDIGALFEAANPTSTVDRVLVATYWFQVIEEQRTVKGQTVNDALKNLGHAVTNITNRYTALMNKKPQLIRQAAKHGKAQQGRKEYTLTQAGLTAVKKMIVSGGDTSDTEE